MMPKRTPEEIQARWEKRRKAIARAVAMRSKGKTIPEIATELDVSIGTIWTWLNIQAVRGEQRKAAS